MIELAEIDTTCSSTGPYRHVNEGPATTPERVIAIPDNADGRDPFYLASRVVSDQDLDSLLRNRKRGRKDHVANFYREQNDEIRRFLAEPEKEGTAAGDKENASKGLAAAIAIKGSFVANILLSILQLYAAISSGSMSLFATMADSIFDPFSNLILNLAHKTSVKWDIEKFPSGKARMETIGNIVYACLMATVSVVLVVESLRTILSHSGEDVLTINIPSVISVGIAFAVKFALFLYCFSLRNSDSQIRMLWEDHRNDLFVNAFGILTNVGGGKLKWWIDPAGAIVISIAILASWSKTAYEQFQLLAGVSASNSYIRFLIYKALTFDERIQKIDTCRAYYSGPKLIVEVDVVMEPATPLWEAHNVSEALQVALERLSQVERAYVHVDFETDHKPEHRSQ
ncbi:CDF manganese transporter [Fimicolochytrium jonesii]|uniref:CDF manganese transporter n=1 Tax=Fimicolochytrium jonesii TaxID=1396493 RepID=UPI0022FE5167|nr:CDF manganese transporter [Fimicolochytrium jonesii]KAI8816668.1 CDF manganese transporter [Fimicolochytrium jonesii]